MKVTGLKIHQVDASQRGNWIFVVVETDAGISGLGEASQSGNDGLVIAALGQLGERLVGQDPTQVEVVWERMVRTANIFAGDSGRVGATAVSAVDQALWDIAGKALEVPVWKLLGGKRREKVRLYANLNRGTGDRSPQGFADAAKRAVDAGFTAVKSTPFDEVHWRRLDRGGMERDVDRGIERLAKTREAIGEEVELLVDCHGRFDLPLALKVAKKVEPLDLFWFEEPVPRTQVEAMREICRLSGQTIAAGEALFGREGFWEYIVGGAAHVIMPDVKHAGGITECHRIGMLTTDRGIGVATHTWSDAVALVANMHLIAALPTGITVEMDRTGNPFIDDLLVEPLVVRDGQISLPEAPGLGIELNEDVVKRYVLPPNAALPDGSYSDMVFGKAHYAPAPPYESGEA